MEKVAIYCRLSEEDKNKSFELQESESIQNQKSLLLSHALSNKWDVYKIYCDEDYSGVDKNRPDFNQLIEDAENKKFNIILCKTQSRFTRDMEMVEKYIHHMFLEWGIRFVTAVDNVDTNIKGSKKARQINGLINEWYLEDLSENVRAVFNHKRNNGEFIGSYAPYGYKKCESNHNKLVVDDEAAQIVRKIFDMRLNGLGMVLIAKWLNENNVLNPTDYRISKGYSVKTIPSSPTQHLWKDYTVRQILQRETYVGNMVQGISKKVSYKSEKTKRIPKKDWIIATNTQEPIIDKSVYYRVQKLMSSYIHPTSKGQAHVLAGKVKCLKCGATMQRLTGKGFFYLRCKSNIRYGTACDNISVKFEDVENEVLRQIQLLVSEITNKDALKNVLTENTHMKSNLDSLYHNNKKLNEEIDKITTTIFNLYSDKVSGLIDEIQFIEFNEHFQKIKSELVTKLERNKSSIEIITGTTVTSNDKDSIVEKYCTIDKLTHECVDELIDHIDVDVIGSKGSHKKDINLDIYWNI